jgi:hypothetical protein
MALSKCKECGRDVSDKAITCPNCGVPMPALSQENIDNITKQGFFARSRWLGGTAFFFGLAWLFFATQTGGPDAFLQALGSAVWPIIGGAMWYIAAEIDRNLYEIKMKKYAAKKKIDH